MVKLSPSPDDNELVHKGPFRGLSSLRPALLLIVALILVGSLFFRTGSDRTETEILLATSPVHAQESNDDEPIAYIGHGAFFDRHGRQIVPTAEFVAKAQSWYRERLVAGLDPGVRTELGALERRLSENLARDGQERLIMQQAALDWLLARSPRTVAEGRMRAKLNAVKYQLSWRLPRRDDLSELRSLEPFAMDPRIGRRLRIPELAPGTVTILQATTSSGQAYIDECAAADVPIPPTIGLLDPTGMAGWRSLGFIPTAEQFIVGTPAEVRVFENSDGMCIALPRYTSSTLATVSLDGVICLSRTTSKVCIWDNQMNGAGFSFPAGTQVPIGVANLAVNPAGQYQGGGAELEFGSGGVCTDCHAGENPYIVHPLADLGGGLLMGDLNVAPLNLPTFGPNRYDPIVAASWPQNLLSHSQPLVPPACSGCHTLNGTGGRFPHLSSELPAYCGTVLAQAVTKTMPPYAPGSQATDPAVIAFRAWCNTAASAGPSDRGDPHLTTTNGINYDFQGAGEFVSLRNSATGFELQTRQTPVLTSFTPGANVHTGLASCVSLNTAAALRVGRHRLSYQPSSGEPGKAGQMQLRIDGKPVRVAATGIDLGDGNRITMAATGGGLDIRLADGTRVILTPNFWSSEGYWYLNVEVLDTPAREGTMGHILGSDWLPLAPNGSSFGPKPASLAASHFVLNRAFADAWRVTDATSLFDYTPGTSTATFTDRGWPPPSGSPCTSISGTPWIGGESRQPVKPMRPEVAQRLCRPVQDEAARENCVFDLTATSNAEMAAAYGLTLSLRDALCPGCSSWTEWLDRDRPGATGDYETLADFLKAGKACSDPACVECRRKDGTPWQLTGDVYRCEPRLGGVCRNADQPDGRQCGDYEVRFCCP